MVFDVLQNTEYSQIVILLLATPLLSGNDSILSVPLVTEYVVLVGLEPFIEEQVVGLESFRKI